MSGSFDEALAIGDALVTALKGLEYEPNNKIKRAVMIWAEPEEEMEVPSVAVMPVGECLFDASDFVPHPIERTFDEKSGTVLWRDAEFVCKIAIHVFAETPQQRARILMAVREKLQDPTGSIYGCYLACPKYFGGAEKVRVTPLSVRYEDNTNDVVSRRRRGVLTVECRLPVLRLCRSGATGISIEQVVTIPNGEEV